MHRTTEIAAPRVATNRVGWLRLRLVLVMIASYLAMMVFLIRSARHPTQIDAVSPDFSPAMIALASCMALSVILTGLFVLLQRGE